MAMELNNGPPAEQMSDTPMGEGGFGSHIANTMTDPFNFKIVYNVERHGACRPEVCCGSCCPTLKGRGYTVIGENFVESNTPIPVCCFPACCCLTRDYINKTYMDKAPYAETIYEKLCGACGAGGTFVNETDINYCCYCINCVCWYNLCTRPCYGGRVGRHSFNRGTCCFNCDTRCCAGACCTDWMMVYVKDSVTASAKLQSALTAFRAKGGKSVDILA